MQCKKNICQDVVCVLFIYKEHNLAKIFHSNLLGLAFYCISPSPCLRILPWCIDWFWSSLINPFWFSSYNWREKCFFFNWQAIPDWPKCCYFSYSPQSLIIWLRRPQPQTRVTGGHYGGFFGSYVEDILEYRDGDGWSKVGTMKNALSLVKYEDFNFLHKRCIIVEKSGKNYLDTIILSYENIYFRKFHIQ